MLAALALSLTMIPPPAPYGATPTPGQLAWHQLETYAFVHFSPNTFTDREWGNGDEDPALFNPTDFDANQIVKSIQAGGFKGLILTCKHHDGFCLWPTKTTAHNISRSPWRGGKGDVVRELSDACRHHGLKFGVYLSPWDRNNVHYGQPEYIGIYRAQLTELLTNYGPIFEVWHDGANGGSGYYGGARGTREIDRRTYYDWPTTWALVRKLQPNATIFSDVGPDIRWAGNESGVVNDPCWTTFDPVGPDGGVAAPGWLRESQSPTGTQNGTRWLPAECDVSIRPGWFWHAAEDDKVRSVANLRDLYFQSVGRGASFLLNVPPDRRGQVHGTDVASLRGFGKWLSETFRTNLARQGKVTANNTRGPSFRPELLTDNRRNTYWATDDSTRTASVELDFGKPTRFNLIRLREAIALGQRVNTFTLDAEIDGQWQTLASHAAIGSCRLIPLATPVTATKLRLKITDAFASPALSEFSAYLEPGH